MALKLPHDVTRKPRTNSTDSHGQRTAPGTGAVSTYKAQVTPMSTEAAYKQFNVELDEPFLMICSVANAQANAIGDKITYDGDDYAIMKSPQIFKGIGPADHGSQVMEKVTNS